MSMDLSTTYLGIELPHPFVAGASPLSDTLDGARALADAGIAMIVLRSLFEEQLDQEALAHHDATLAHTESHGEARSYLPEPAEFVFGPDEYLGHLAAVRQAVSVPVVASLNGHTQGGWTGFARRIADAGADALELNLFDVVTDPHRSSADIEHELVEITASVCSAIRVPVAVKLSPFYTSLPHLANRLRVAGARGFVLFNRYFEPDIETDLLEVHTQLQLSTPRELQLRLRWLAILSGTVGGDFVVTGGVHDVEDAVKAIMCGAHTVQIVATLLRHGLGRIEELRQGLADWLREHDYASLRQMRGSMDSSRAPDPRAYERANYLRALQTHRGFGDA
ncbi:MAG TPA: dihydroorotate dehydrogenase-like protein [bacterium]|nr:dihydroorotate dehydrogenase-like protein [bacterium]